MPKNLYNSRNLMLEDIINHYDDVADTYDQQYTSIQWKIRDTLNMDSLRPYLPRKGTVLDAGAGTGRSIRTLLSRNSQSRVVCLDASEKMVQKLCEKHNRSLRKERVFVVLGNVLRLPFKTEVFDFVHIQALPLKVPSYGDLPTSELVRVLRKGCYMTAIIGTTGNSAIAKLVERAVKSIEEGHSPKVGLEEINTYLEESRICWEKTFYQYYCLKPEQLEKICVEAGLDVVEMAGRPMLVHLFSEQTLRFLYRDSKTRRQILDLEKMLSRERSIIRNAGNIQIIARKQLITKELSTAQPNPKGEGDSMHHDHLKTLLCPG